MNQTRPKITIDMIDSIEIYTILGTNVGVAINYFDQRPTEYRKDFNSYSEAMRFVNRLVEQI